ncbi:MAG: PSD1 domain-containing protein [Planctomycetales bacterium]|nr:PSD1 domain-containing protein [Planctomycetales bacterium]
MSSSHRPALLAAILVSTSFLHSVMASDKADRLFTLKVLPLLKDKCLGCHGGDKEDIKGDFSVAARSDLLRGGESGEPAVVPGKPAESTLLQAIKWENLEMPPKENDRLNDAQVQLIEQWIELEAPWPDEATQQRFRDEEAMAALTDEGQLVATSGGTSQEWSNRRYLPEDLWAFMPVKPVTELLPEDLPREEAIDYFINSKLAAAGLTSSPAAEPAQLIRRATLDLTGLPPTPDDCDRFVNAYSQNPESAWKQLIDRLLASPQYGEHWGRHWLDVTRYADTGGMSNDYERSNMWRYRDYVIRSFNADKPYNEFIVEQLAGDELADESVSRRTGQTNMEDVRLNGNYNQQESEWLIATGFLRLGPWDNAMVEADEARQIYLDDLVNITGQTFLAQTMRCCKCHDHKFDPLPTRDYYRIYAAFSTTHMAERPVPFLPQEDRSLFAASKSHVNRMLQFAVAEKDKILAKQENAARQWYEENNLPYKTEDDRKNDPDEMKPPRYVGLDHVEQGQRKVREQDEWIWNRRLERYEPMAQSVYSAPSYNMAWNGARKLRIQRQKAGDTSPETHILLGGALTALGDQVLPGVLSAISLPANNNGRDPFALTEEVSGRRLGMARWIADPSNPLTTRSIVNRIWQYHFGRAIAANANNFGAKGAKPTHPELLDYLAGDFVQAGWSIKSMHRLIMMSDVYRRDASPLPNTSFNEVDPTNALLSHFPRRRLTAEELRDSILAATGELVHCSGGLPIMPEMNMEVALQPRMIQFSLAPAYQPSPTPQLRNRRSIYAYQVRGQADPFTELFNQPNPNESCEMRETAAVTPQAFTLLNSDQMTDRSIAMALRLQAEQQQLEDQIQLAFRLILSRKATGSETERLIRYVTEMTEYHQQSTPTTVDYPTSITRSLVEEFSGETFDYEEILPGFENYTSDKKPGDVTAATRGLADMCLLLFNTNEFMFVE